MNKNADKPYMKGFFLFFISVFPLILFSSCTLRGSDYLALQGSNEGCDIFTERCPRSGSGFSISGGGRGSSRKNYSNDNNSSPRLPSLSSQFEPARKYSCEQYKEMFDDIRTGVDVDLDKECIMFEDHALLCPHFEGVRGGGLRGCLRVREVDDPITDDDESEEFDMVCIEDGYLYLNEQDNEDLRNAIRDKEEITGAKWREAETDLDSTDRGIFFW